MVEAGECEGQYLPLAGEVVGKEEGEYFDEGQERGVRLKLLCDFGEAPKYFHFHCRGLGLPQQQPDENPSHLVVLYERLLPRRMVVQDVECKVEAI